MPVSEASEPVRMVLVGLNFGQGILRMLRRDAQPCRVIGVCDLDAAKAAALAAESGLTHYPTLDDALRDDRVEAVALFSGPAGRAALVERIAKAGRDIITTKPFETDAAAARRALECAAGLGRVVHLNSPGPHPAEDIAQIERWRDENGLGRPIAMEARTWARYSERPDGSWYDNPALCPAAPMLRLGIYFINDFAPLLGPVRRVHASQARIFTGRPTADHVHALLVHAGGATSSVLASFCVGDGRPYQDEVLLAFERGAIRRRMVRRKAPDMAGDFAELTLQTGDREFSARTEPGHYAGWYQWDAFHRAVRSRAGTPAPLVERVVAGIGLFNAVARAAQTGEPQEMPPPA